MTKRIKSGISGLDKLMEGGYPKDSVILVSGGPGTGKTIFGLQFIYYGAKNNEPGVYISFEQEPEQLKNSVKRFNMDFDKLEKEGKVIILRIKDARDITEILKVIKNSIKKIKAKRLVIDSISSMEIFASTFKSMARDLPLGVIGKGIRFLPPPEAIVKRLMYKIIDYFKELDVTTLLISESRDTQYSRYGVSEFICDGIVKLEAEAMGDKLQRNILIVKMRETKIDGTRHSIDITKKGIELLD